MDSHQETHICWHDLSGYNSKRHSYNLLAEPQLLPLHTTSSLLWPILKGCATMADCNLIPREKRDGVPNIDGWIPLAHSHPELVRVIRDRIRSFEPDAKLSFRMREHQIFSQQSEEPPIQDEILLLEEYYDAFNEIFFFSPRCDTTVPDSKWSEREQMNGRNRSRRPSWHTQLAIGLTCHLDIKSRLLYTFWKESRVKHAQRMKNYIESLLHEMIHAIILIYTCPCADCGNRYTFDLRETGHGRTWQAIAHAVEKFCFNKLGLELDLGRALGLASEINAAYTGILATYELDCPLFFEHVGKLGGWIKSEGGEELPSGLDD